MLDVLFVCLFVILLSAEMPKMAVSGVVLVIKTGKPVLSGSVFSVSPLDFSALSIGHGRVSGLRLLSCLTKPLFPEPILIWIL